MIKHLQEEKRYVEITGFKNVEITTPDHFLKAQHKVGQLQVAVQFFNANLIATWEHLYFAVIDALMAFRTNRNISKSIAVEVMLYSSAQRQIRKAIELIGVKSGCSDLAMIVEGESLEAVKSATSSISKQIGKTPDDGVLAFSPAKKKAIRTAFGITENELLVTTKGDDVERALVDLVIERMALLSTRL